MSATAGATAPQPTPETRTATSAGTTVAGRKSTRAPERRRAGSTATGLGRLTAVTVLACVVNGAAAYTFVSSDAVSAQQAATARATSLQTVSTTVSSMGDTARELRDNPRDAAAYRAETARGAQEITRAASRAAGAPAEFRDDADDYAALSAGYSTYVAELERARSVPAAQADAAFRVAEETRTTDVAPVLARVQEANTARGDGAQVAATATTGILGASTLVSLASLLFGANWLARRTKRVINPGLLSATLVSAATSAYAFSGLLENPPVPNGPWTAPVVLLGGLTAAGLAWAGLEQRRKEYR